LPHLHNTDGFFAAVFEKQESVKPAPKSVPESAVELPSESVTDTALTRQPHAK
jgi:hypothetical protein